MRRARAFSLAALVSLALPSVRAATAPAQPAPPAPVVGVTLQHLEQAVRFDAVLPGRLIAYALRARAGGPREVLLLVTPMPDAAPSAGPGAEGDDAGPIPCDPAHLETTEKKPACRLLRLETGGEGRLVTLRDDLPSDSDDLKTVDLDGDGLEEILIGRPGRLIRLNEAGDTTLIEQAQGVDAPGPLFTLPHAGVAPMIFVSGLGSVSQYTAPAESGRWAHSADYRIPIKAARKDSDLILKSRHARMVGNGPKGGPIIAVGPESQGKQRLLSILIQPDADTEARRIEAWSRLPSPEDVIERFFLMLRGRPCLLVTTRSAGKLSFFEEKMLRLFPLEYDRTQTGQEPLLSVESRMNLWQKARPAVLDADRDGLPDLVIGYWKGLKDDTLVLDTYRGQPDGSFSGSPASTSFDVEQADRSVLELPGDVDKDGLLDLVLVGQGRVQIYSGSGDARSGKRVVEAAPRWSIPLGHETSHIRNDEDLSIELGNEGLEVSSDSVGPPGVAVVDLDGDGAFEILLAKSDPDGRGFLQIIRLAAHGGAP